ncbi:protein disulfide isomerase pTAC5, chloroplastic [Punica granatum]|uniref:Uncharacterized protein n=2 Tax=Punica granatum TaxID=22663 RepID=A0A2I0IE60_PUNGR|nr:protein disulfide isomerase pTAC5, chloroplastic [Punica granatum]PKI42294.1 hypothetical protein CRG98_037312 [Punica granatum]
MSPPPPFSLSLSPTLSLHQSHRTHFSAPSPFPISAPSLHLHLHKSTTHLHVPPLSSSPDTPSHSLEESRWLREEQRWLREEQRWLREERRWARERESLLVEIAQLRLRVQALERQAPIEVLKEKNLIAESGSVGRGMVLEGKGEEVSVEERAVVEEKVIRVVNEGKKRDERKSSDRRTLRVGAEGDEVKSMQEALQKLGFYSGEEDMEYCNFSSGTESAVKTWQASIGVKEDGIMTTELLEILYFGQLQGADSFVKSDKNGGANGAAVSSITGISENDQRVVKESNTKNEASQQRVFLLGENRWEEPSRLVGRDKQDMKMGSSKSTTQCLACRGEGRLMCTECDGTGEPNIEPQFLEWVGEGMHCPYCEGLGYTVCDVCEGKTVA